MTPNRYAAVGAAVLAATALAVAGAGPASARPSTAELSQTVVIADNHFTPDDVGVHVGDKVTWTNTDEAAHAVNSVSGPEAFGTGRDVLHNGDSFTWKFYRPGIYHYVDSLHRGVRGTIRVGAHQHTDVPPSDDWSGRGPLGPARPPVP